MASEASSTSTLRAALGAWVVALGCARDEPAPTPAPAPAPVVAAPAPPVEDKIYEVNIASNPSGAKVLLQDAELGTTPHVLRFKQETALVLRLDGHRDAELTVGPQSDPNVVVQLTALPGGAVASAPSTEANPSSTPRTGGSASKPRATGDAAVPAATPTEPAPVPKPAAPKSSGLPYDDVAAAKADYQAGTIDRDAYDQAVRKLKVRRNEKLLVIKELYRTGAIDKDEYARRKRIIDNEYRGT